MNSFDVLEARIAVSEMLAGKVMESIDVDDEGDECLVWWSDQCSWFHCAYNGRFRGAWTGSFSNMRVKQGAKPCYERG